MCFSGFSSIQQLRSDTFRSHRNCFGSFPAGTHHDLWVGWKMCPAVLVVGTSLVLCRLAFRIADESVRILLICIVADSFGSLRRCTLGMLQLLNRMMHPMYHRMKPDRLVARRNSHLLISHS